MHYALRVQGHLDPSWSDRFGGLRIEQQEAGTTLLSGSLPDQAALHGLLLQIVRLGLLWQVVQERYLSSYDCCSIMQSCSIMHVR